MINFVLNKESDWEFRFFVIIVGFNDIHKPISLRQLPSKVFNDFYDTLEMFDGYGTAILSP